jgi:soluble P-type ATPase
MQRRTDGTLTDEYLLRRLTMKIEIPGKNELVIEQVVFDYNGTLATDGIIRQAVKTALVQLSKQLKVVVLTADTYGTVGKELQGTGIQIHRFPEEQAGLSKQKYVMASGPMTTATVGNGFNDMPMSRAGALSITVLGNEGCHGRLLAEADIVVSDILNVFELFNKPNRIKATIRT